MPLVNNNNYEQNQNEQYVNEMKIWTKYLRIIVVIN